MTTLYMTVAQLTALEKEALTLRGLYDAFLKAKEKPKPVRLTAEQKKRVESVSTTLRAYFSGNEGEGIAHLAAGILGIDSSAFDSVTRVFEKKQLPMIPGLYSITALAPYTAIVPLLTDSQHFLPVGEVVFVYNPEQHTFVRQDLTVPTQLFRAEAHAYDKVWRFATPDEIRTAISGMKQTVAKILSRQGVGW